MIKIFLALFFSGLLLSFGSSPVSAQTNTDNDTSSNSAKVKADVSKRGTGEKKRVRVKLLNGSKLNGYISQTGEDSFTFVYTKTGQSTVIPYSDVKKVEGRGLAGGAKIAIIAGAIVGGTLTVLYIVFTNALRDN